MAADPLRVGDTPGVQRILNLLTTGQTQLLAAVNAIIGLLIAFNAVFTQSQVAAVDVAVNAVLAVVLALVTQTANAKEAAAEAKAAVGHHPAKPQ